MGLWRLTLFSSISGHSPKEKKSFLRSLRLSFFTAHTAVGPVLVLLLIDKDIKSSCRTYGQAQDGSDTLTFTREEYTQKSATTHLFCIAQMELFCRSF